MIGRCLSVRTQPLTATGTMRCECKKIFRWGPGMDFSNHDWPSLSAKTRLNADLVPTNSPSGLTSCTVLCCCAVLCCAVLCDVRALDRDGDGDENGDVNGIPESWPHAKVDQKAKNGWNSPIYFIDSSALSSVTPLTTRKQTVVQYSSANSSYVLKNVVFSVQFKSSELHAGWGARTHCS